MPATDAFIGPQPLHRIPTPQSASQNGFKLRTSSSTPPVFFEHLRSIHIEACLWFSWLGEVQSVLLACMRRQKLNIPSQQKYWSPCASYRVPRNQPSKEKSEAKNGFNFGYTFWGQFKYRQEGREAKTEAKNGFEKASRIPAAMGHGT